MHLRFCALSFPEEAGDGVVEETGDGVEPPLEGHVGEVAVGVDTHSGDISGVGVALGNRDKGGKVGNNSKFSFGLLIELVVSGHGGEACRRVVDWCGIIFGWCGIIFGWCGIIFGCCGIIFGPFGKTGGACG